MGKGPPNSLKGSRARFARTSGSSGAGQYVCRGEGSKGVRNSPARDLVLRNHTSSGLTSILHFHFTPNVKPVSWKLPDYQSTLSFSAAPILKSS